MTFKKETVLKTLFPEDILSTAKGLTDDEVGFLQQVDSLLESKCRENINQHWIDATIPENYFKDLGELGYFDNPLLYKDRPNARVPSQLFQLFMSCLLVRFGISLATLLGVHQGLGHNIFYFGGSKEQITKYILRLQSHELCIYSALAESEYGSDVARGLETAIERQGDTWAINGEKKWTGGAHVPDVIPAFTVNKETGKLHCFVVRLEQDGVNAEAIDNKIALCVVPNALIRLTNVKVNEADRLQDITSFKNITKTLYSIRAGVAYAVTGDMVGTLCAALGYVTERKQFDKPISKYRLIQGELAVIQGNLAQVMATCTQLANMQAHGEYGEVATSTTGTMNALRLHETVTVDRGITSSSGILADNYDIAYFFSDAEAIYTYEGVHEINVLITGHALTRGSVFV